MNSLLIGLILIIGLLAVGKVFSILSKIFFIILIVAAGTILVYLWQNGILPL